MTKVSVVKNGEARLVKSSRLKEYLDAGWKKPDSNQGEEVIRLKPPARSSRAAVKPAEEDDNDNNQGD